MEGHLPDKIKEERAGIIKKISAEKINTFLKSNIGSEQEVLIEKRPAKNGKFKGVTRNYITVQLSLIHIYIFAPRKISLRKNLVKFLVFRKIICQKLSVGKKHQALNV